MRNVFLFFLLFALSVMAEVDVSVPRSVVSGETNEYKINSDKSISITGLPRVKHLQWGTPAQSSYTSIINGRMKREQGVRIPFRYNGKGSFIIPSFEVVVDGKKVKLAAKEIRVSNNPLEDMTDVEITFPGRSSAPKSVVIGQEIPVQMKFFVDENLKNEWDFPSINVNEFGIVKEFSHDGVSANNENYNKSFRAIGSRGSYKLERELHNGRRYVAFTLETSLIAQKKGPLEASFSLDLEIETGRDFFNRRTKTYTLKGETPIIQVTDLPALQEEAFNLDLIGDWELSSSLSKDEVKLGYPFSFKLKIYGKGDINRILLPKAREFDIEGFDVQKIDFTKKQKGSFWEAELNFILNANSATSQFPELKFATFNIESMKYDVYRAVHDLKVSVPTNQTGQSQQNIVREYQVPQQKEEPKESTQEPIVQEDISHISSNKLLLRETLWKNIHPAYFLVVPVAPLLFILSLLLTVRRPDEAELARKQKLARKKAIKEINKLKNLKGSELSQYLNEACLPAVGQALGLGASACSEEIAEKLRDENLAKALKDSSHMAYLPGQQDAKLSGSELSSSLMKAFKSFSFILICLFSINSSWADEQIQKSATELYEAGKYEEALKLYEQSIGLGELDPYLIYNAGNAAFKSTQFPKALAYYEKAARLLPRDERIAFNLKLCRQKMELNDSSLTFIDVLRPDEWLQLSVVLWGVFWLALIILRQKRFLKASLVIVLLLLAILPVGLYVVQMKISYQNGQALALSKAELYSSPNEEKKTDKTLKAGQSFTIQEKLEGKGYTRIKIAGAEFFVKSEQVFKYWP